MSEKNEVLDAFGQREEKKSTYRPYYKIKEYNPQEPSANVFRIAPPFGSLKDSGHWAKYYKIHYGYRVEDSRSNDGFRAKPFECIEKMDFKTKEIIQRCPECDSIAANNKALENAREKAKENGLSEAQIEEATSSLVQYKKDHTLDKKWYMYAKNLAGEWNILLLGQEVKKGLNALLDKIMDENKIDGLSPNKGVWFSFKRTGKGFNTTYSVDVKTESTVVDGNVANILKTAPLTIEDVKALQTLPALENMMDNKRLNHDQIATLVASHGDPQTVAKIFGLPVLASAPKEQYPAPTEQASNTPELLALEAKLAELRNKASQAKTGATTGAPAQRKSISEMTAEEFKNKFNSQ